MKTDDTIHPGISIHKIPVAGGAAGLLFVVGSMLVFLLGVPMLRWFFGGAIVFGLAASFALRLAPKRFPRIERFPLI